MNRYQMFEKIGERLKDGEILRIDVTNARGRTLVEQYHVSNKGYKFIKRFWNARGNLLCIYNKLITKGEKLPEVYYVKGDEK